jgi:uncharacterized membrane protein (DUF4010 family)
MSPELRTVLCILIAALGGAAVGVERERSGHASGPGAHFAGVRTFTLLGGLAGTVGWLWTAGLHLPAAVLLAGETALVVAAYSAASRHNIDGTTEVAALIVLAAGVLAGTNHLGVSSGIIAVTALLLVEKSRLHALVASIEDAGLRAGFRFAVMAVVILPLLPQGPYGPLGGVRPRQLWTMVLFFSGLSFAGYIARQFVGTQSGYPIAGLIGGLISSTQVTFTFARLSRTEVEAAVPLAVGVIGACAVMYVRALFATAVLNPAVATALAPYLVAPFLVSALAVLAGLRSRENIRIAPPSNPLQFAAALQMAALFQAVLFAVHVVRQIWGQAGVLVSGAVLGLTDVDALVISMARSAPAQVPLTVAALAIAIGVLSNTVLKLALALAIGRNRFRRLGAGGLAAITAVSAFALAVLGHAAR